MDADRSSCCRARQAPGKTRLAEEALAGSGRRDLRAGGRDARVFPFSPITGALRDLLRTRNGRSGELQSGPHLALVLPEHRARRLRRRTRPCSRPSSCGLATMASRRPAAVLLDDLQWSDEAALEFLAALAPSLGDAHGRSGGLSLRPGWHGIPIRYLVRHDLRQRTLELELSRWPHRRQASWPSSCLAPRPPRRSLGRSTTARAAFRSSSRADRDAAGR